MCCAFKLPAVLTQSPRSSVYTRSIWMSSMVACRNQMRTRRKSMSLNIVVIISGCVFSTHAIPSCLLTGVLKSVVYLEISSVVVQTGWKKGNHWLHLWRQHCDRAWPSVRQRWRQFREQWIWRRWRHPRYWWENGFGVYLIYKKVKLQCESPKKQKLCM